MDDDRAPMAEYTALIEQLCAKRSALVQTMVANPEQITGEQIRDLAALHPPFWPSKPKSGGPSGRRCSERFSSAHAPHLRCLKRAALTPSYPWSSWSVPGRITDVFPIDRRELADWVHGSASAALRDSHLSAHPLDSMLLPHTDNSEARWRRSRRFSLRVRLRPPTPSTEPSSGDSRPGRPLRPTIVQPVVGWTNGLGRRSEGHLACRLEARHRAEREAHVLRLADLHQQRTLLVMAETLEHTDEVSGGSGAGSGHQSSRSCSLRCG